ncbi:O-acetyl-ADP-ribose deacetylase [Martelella alba]|uniref:O-acetyl-ADP-ribose deacetylase n=1 Tax=Martelella alba TaxID=2590451 RepID=A0ABY2SNV1_9HYPH|nr:O-acetyl-ADP-ribose deacetylase [Martelella alba]TKI07677.1 O-acetyl-ADP-ribose deacetylase [Martelella alba]
MSARVTVQVGDITKLAVDAIVNAANSALAGGGGVDGAIHRAAGPALARACEGIRRRRGGCPVGEAVLTEAGDLPASAVIHTVGPVWRGGGYGETENLRRAYLSCLSIAERQRMGRIAFPNISTGVYGFPKDQAAEIAIAAVNEFLARHRWPEKVIFVCFDQQNAALYQAKLPAVN